MIIRPATLADVPAILEIYNEAVLNTTASYDYEPSTYQARLAWFHEHVERSFPVYAAEDDAGQVVGWSSLSEFRTRIGYRYTSENSLYVAPAQRGKGIGKKLMAPLVDAGRRLGFHSIIAVVDADNVASLQLHKSFGFERVGYLKQVGFKFGRWLDVVYLELLL
ncbi:MAG: N-acetyltransferase family protein [Chloroflexi bacterium]|nr:N-acetyltransferase family protein [Chloroflexota bacterium]